MGLLALGALVIGKAGHTIFNITMNASILEKVKAARAVLALISGRTKLTVRNLTRNTLRAIDADSIISNAGLADITLSAELAIINITSNTCIFMQFKSSNATLTLLSGRTSDTVSNCA